MKKHILTLLIAVAMVFSVMAVATSADTTDVAAIGGTTYDDLHEAMVAAKSGETVELLCDVDLAGAEWEPVSFKGKFDGKGFAIKNLTINKPGVSSIGFITSLNSTFENVTFTNPTVTGGENTGVLAGRAGGSAAYAKNITVNGTIRVETTHSGYARAGAIVGGWAYGKYENITVDGGDKSVSYIKHTGGGDGRYVAGIVGHADAVDAYINCTVKNITISSTNGGWLCGGIAGPGPAYGLTSGCSVENVNINADYSGGMFGWYYGTGTIENSSVKDVTFTAGSTKNGAIGGYSTNTDATLTNVVVENVSNVGGEPLLAPSAAKIGNNYYGTLAEAIDAAVNGDTVTILVAGTYTVPTGKNITVTGAVDGVVFDNIGARNMGGASVTFNNVTFDYYPNVNYTGLQHSGNLVYNNCIINGQVFLYGISETFNNCTFNQNSSDAYNVWTYGAKDVIFNDCTFNSAGKSVLIYSEQSNLVNNVAVTDCDFIATAAVDGKAAIEMDSSLTSGINLTIDSQTTVTGFGTGNVSGNSLWNNKKGNTGVNNDITVVVGGETVLEPEFDAQVGGVNYETLQEAINACVAGDNTIILLADCADDVTVKQVEGVNIVIDGNDKKFSGTITIHGNARYTGAETLTIKNVNFVTSDGSTNHYFIDSNSTGSVERYAHNLTVDNCTFTAEGEAVHKAVGVRIRQGFNINVSNCKAVNMHSLVQLYGNKGVNITATTLTGCAEGISLGTSTAAVIDGCTIDAIGYGIRADGEGAYDATITNTTITSEKPVIVRRAKGNYTLTIGSGNNFTSTSEKGYTIIFTNGNDSEELQKPTGTYTVQGAGLAKEKVYPSGVGDIVRAYVRADGSRIMVDMANVNFYKSVELKLYSGSELLTTATLNSAEYPYGRFTELTGSIYITDIGDTWPNTPWTPHDIVIPDRIELVVDGEVADVWNGILNSNYDAMTDEDWSALGTTTECVYSGMCWNNYYHWRECYTCEDIIQLSSHSWTEAGVIKAATETETGLLRYVCTCGGYKDVVIPVLGHEHVAGTEWKHDDLAHWNECACGELMNVAAHTWNDGVIDGEKVVYTCTVCGAQTEEEAPHVHVAGTEFKYNDETHWNECECGEKLNEANHLWVTDKVENGTIYSKCVLCDATAETPEQTDSYDDESVSYLLPALAISVITVAFAAVAAKRKFN